MHLLCHQEPLKQSRSWSSGCSFDVLVRSRPLNSLQRVIVPRIHTPATALLRGMHQGTRQQPPSIHAVALLPRHPRHAFKAILILLTDHIGLLLVHDLANTKSYTNLWMWMDEVTATLAQDESLGSTSGTTTTPSASVIVPVLTSPDLGSSRMQRKHVALPQGHRASESPFTSPSYATHGAGNVVPLLVVGTKSDVATRTRRACEIAEEYGGRWMDVCTQRSWSVDPQLPSSLMPTSVSASPQETLKLFLDQVIERKFYRSGSMSRSGSREFLTSSNKLR